MTATPTAALDSSSIPRQVLGVAQERSSGLLLVCGSPGSGKSTTLAALSDEITRAQGRQSSDVLLVDEIDGATSLAEAIQRAGEGRLVLAAARVPVPTAVSAIGELVGWPALPGGPTFGERLADHLIGVVCQCLLPRASGDGRVPAFEVLSVRGPIPDWIRRGRLSEIPHFMGVCSARGNLLSMNQSLATLALRGSVTREAALLASPSPEELREMLARADGLLHPERFRASPHPGARRPGPPTVRRAATRPGGGRFVETAFRAFQVVVLLLIAAFFVSRDVFGRLPDERLFRPIAIAILISWAGLVLALLWQRGFRLPRRRQADDFLGLLDALPGARENVPSVLYLLAIPTAIGFGALTLALIGEERFLDDATLAVGGFVGGASVSLVLYDLALKAWVRRRAARRLRSHVHGGKRR